MANAERGTSPSLTLWLRHIFWSHLAGRQGSRGGSRKKTRWLATADRSRVSIRGRSSKNLPHIYSLITMQNLVVVSRTVCEHVGGPKILETLGPPSLWMWAWLTPRNTILPHVCKHGKFRRSMSPNERHYGDPSRPAFLDHSRSFEPTRIDRLPMSSY